MSNAAPRGHAKRRFPPKPAGRRMPSLGGRAAGDRRDATPVLCPAILTGLAADRTLLAIRDRIYPRRGDAETDQILFDGIRPARAKRDIVFARTAFIAMTLDGHTYRRILAKPSCLALQRRFVILQNIVLVEVEMDGVSDIDPKVLGAARYDRRRRSASRWSARRRRGGGFLLGAASDDQKKRGRNRSQFQAIGNMHHLNPTPEASKRRPIRAARNPFARTFV